MTGPRVTQLRAWAAWDDKAIEDHGTDAGVFARREANRIAYQLGELDSNDLYVIEIAQRGYRRESLA